MSQLADLALPFPSKYVHQNPSGGGSYVKHHVVTQRLLQVCGPFSFHIVEIIRGDVPPIEPNPSAKSKRAQEGRPALVNVAVGVIARLSVTIDGQRIDVEEVGDCEEPHNWTTDGQRLKDAASDAIKRCAARFGLGLHLWSQAEFFLHEKLKQVDPAAVEPPASPLPTAEEEQAGDSTTAVSPAAPSLALQATVARMSRKAK